MRSRLLLSVVALTALSSAAALAQGNLSTQGFGYPAGVLSTRALGAGGAIGEIDPLSSANPAAISSFGGAALYFQADPESRTLHVGNATESAKIARYPLVSAAIPLTESFMLGLSVSNFLDRTFETSARRSQVVGDSAVLSTTAFKSDGAMADLRLGLAWAPQSWLRLGVGAHAFTGDNRVRNRQVFDDTLRFAALIDTATVGYSGSALSAGFEAIIARAWSVAGSYRRGGGVSLQRGDTTLARANIPDRLGMSVAFLGIRGSSIAVRTSKDTWSRMAGLGSASVRITDGWDTSVGADMLGPRVGQRAVQFRAGARWRTLPFGTATSSVSEKSYSLGAGTSFARGRASMDFAGIRATRDAGAGVSETANTLSIGITVRP
ncbi:hypothetical protein BH09GEM1_BH09GEM1_31060 [soil metagenome]